MLFVQVHGTKKKHKLLGCFVLQENGPCENQTTSSLKNVKMWCGCVKMRCECVMNAVKCIWNDSV